MLSRIVFFVVIFLTTTGNSLVIISVIKFPWLHTATNMFVVMLSSFDVLMGLPIFVNRRIYDSLESDVQNVTTDSSVRACQSQLFIAIFSFWGNLVMVAIISLDRFIFIQYPFKYHFLITKSRAAVFCAMSVVISAAGAGFVLGTNSREMYIPCDFQTNVNAFKIMNITLIAIGGAIVSILYGRIACVTCKAAKVAPSSGGAGHVAENNQSFQRSQSKITKVMVLVLGVYMTSYIMVLVSDFAVGGRHELLSVTLFIRDLLWMVSLDFTLPFFNLKRKTCSASASGYKQFSCLEELHDISKLELHLCSVIHTNV